MAPYTILYAEMLVILVIAMSPKTREWVGRQRPGVRSFIGFLAVASLVVPALIRLMADSTGWNIYPYAIAAYALIIVSLGGYALWPQPAQEDTHH